MPPKKVTKKNLKVTLKDAIAYIESLGTKEDPRTNSKAIYRDVIINLVAYYRDDYENYIMLTLAEKLEEFGDEDVTPILQDYDKIEDIIMNRIIVKKNGEPISNETRKTYFLSVFTLSNNVPTWKSKKDGIPLPESIRKQYGDKAHEINELNTAEKDLNIPKGTTKQFVDAYPNYGWFDLIKDYDNFVKAGGFSNNKVGRTRLQAAVLVGFYTYHIPRRLEDYFLMKVYFKRPKKIPERENTLVLNKDGDSFMYIDDFKMRKKAKGKNIKDVNPRFDEKVNPELADLILKYVTLMKIKEGENLFDTADASKVLARAFGKVFDKKYMGLNVIRHLWGTWFNKNQHNFNNAQKRDIFVKMGDTRARLPTPYGYAMALEGQEKKTADEIRNEVIEKQKAEEMAKVDAEEEGSVVDMDINVPLASNYERPSNASLDELYRQYGETIFRLKMIEKQISAHLGLP